MPTPEEQKVFDDAIRKIETKFRVETYLMKIGASEEAAKLISSSPDQIKKFVYDGVDLRFGKSDLTAADDPNAREYYLTGPFKGLFAAAADKAPNGDDHHAQPDPALLASARAGNRTAYSKLARDAFNGDVKALDAALAVKGDDQLANGHDKSTNPFKNLRTKSGAIDPVQMEKVSSFIRAAGTKAAAAVARSAGLKLDGTPIDPRYL
jgi:hypothetical protein